MLLQQIVGTLDAELDRLGKIREIVVKLGRSHKIIERFQAEMLTTAAVPEPPEPKQRATPAKQAVPAPTEPTKPAGVHRAHRSVEVSAFAKAIPAGPVVVSAQELHAKKEQKAPARSQPSPKAREEQAPESSEKLARDLSHKWLSSRQ